MFWPWSNLKSLFLEHSFIHFHFVNKYSIHFEKNPPKKQVVRFPFAASTEDRHNVRDSLSEHQSAFLVSHLNSVLRQLEKKSNSLTFFNTFFSLSAVGDAKEEGSLSSNIARNKSDKSTAWPILRSSRQTQQKRGCRVIFAINNTRVLSPN